MSRLGIKPIIIPKGTTIYFTNSFITIKGIYGELHQLIDNSLIIIITENDITIKRLNDKKTTKAYHGLIRVLIQNMILGVTKKFSKLLIVEGIGYKFKIEANILILYMGFSHLTYFPIPKNLILNLELPTRLTISGINKEEVGFFSARIRSIKPPEPYKGKGIKYNNEIIKRKAGKTRK